jgi:hypothetical protein
MAFAPLLIMAAASAASSAAAAHAQSSAAGKANKAQQVATDKAMFAQRTNADRAASTVGAIYNQNRGNMEPWKNVGADAINTLGSLTGVSRQPYTMNMPNSGSTLMQAPDGSQRPVPNDKVSFFQSRGAKLVPNAQAPAPAGV